MVHSDTVYQNVDTLKQRLRTMGKSRINAHLDNSTPCLHSPEVTVSGSEIQPMREFYLFTSDVSAGKTRRVCVYV